MNSLFLFPYELNNDSTFKMYDEEKGDTLNLKFKNKAPEFFYADGSPTDSKYTIENLIYPNANKDSLNAWIIRPKGEYNGTTLFFLHGNAGNLVYQYRLATPFAERGYKVFLFDYSEFGFSQGKATRKNVLIDANSSLDYLLNLEEFKNDQILVYGQSLGGHLATVITKQNQEKVDGMVIEGAFSSHDDIAHHRVPVFGKWFVGERYSAKDSIPLIKKPVLIVHSINDKAIPFEQGRILYDAATEPKEFFEIDSSHLNGPIYYADEIVSRMKRLFPIKN